MHRRGLVLTSLVLLASACHAAPSTSRSTPPAGQVRGPLHGIPVLLKDNIDAVGMANSAGSLALAEHRPTDDAFLVTRLREAGAVILGKANLSEWANFRSTRSSSGWSSRGGQTRNPYVLDRSPCGSRLAPPPAGTPSLTVPLGHIAGLPIGLTFMSGPYTEAAHPRARAPALPAERRVAVIHTVP